MQLNLRADASSGTAIRTACLAGPRCAMCSSKSQMTFAENIALKYHINMEQKPDISSSGADPAYVNLKVREQVLQRPFTQTDLKSYDTVQPLLSFAVRSHISE